MTDIALPASFEEKMKARIKESIGDLITDEQLSALVAEGVKDAFFKPITSKTGYRDIAEPALIVSILTPLLRSQVEEHVKRWLAENPDVVTAAINEMAQKKMAGVLADVVNNIFSNAMYNLQQNMQQAIANLTNR